MPTISKKEAKTKKAEVPAQIMMYILAIILFGLIMIFGYSSIVSMRQTGEDVSLVQFKSQIEGDIKKMSMETGRTIRTFEYVSPGGFSEICFADSSYIGTSDSIKLSNLKNSGCKDKGVIIDSITSGVQNNMFLFPGTFSYEVGMIVVENGCHCFDTKSGRISLVMQGKGDATVIKTPPSQKYCQNAQEGSLCDGLDIVFGSGYKSKCCEEYNLCC